MPPSCQQRRADAKHGLGMRLVGCSSRAIHTQSDAVDIHTRRQHTKIVLRAPSAAGHICSDAPHTTQHVQVCWCGSCTRPINKAVRHATGSLPAIRGAVPGSCKTDLRGSRHLQLLPTVSTATTVSDCPSVSSSGARQVPSRTARHKSQRELQGEAPLGRTAPLGTTGWVTTGQKCRAGHH